MVTQVSADGTQIGYRTSGSGPGLVVIHGAMETSADYEGFAEALASDFTVHVLDRRGRGLSGPHGPAHSLRTEIEDVRAVVEATGAQRLFGVSSGALIALQAALDLPAVTHVAAYEPPVNAPDLKRDVFQRFEGEIANGQWAESMATILRGLEVGPRLLRWLPRPLMVALMRRFMAEDGDGIDALLPTALHDFRIVEEGSQGLERFQALRSRVLLVGGSKSPRYLKDALSTVAGLLNAQRVELRGADHNSAGQRPQLVVPALRTFFSSGSERARTRSVAPEPPSTR